MIKKKEAVKTDLGQLEEKCKLLEDKCNRYVKVLKRSNEYLRREIRRQKCTEKKLEESEVRFRTIFEYAPFGTAMADADGKILLVNKALCDMLGYQKDELETMHFREITYPEDVKKDALLFKQLTRGEIDHYSLEKRYRCKNRKAAWASLSVTRIAGTGGNPPMIISMVEDITKRKTAEEALKRSHDHLEKLVAERTAEIGLLKDRLQAENELLKQELANKESYGAIIGSSPVIKSVISQIEMVASTQANVLILGESGTGKELIAREIHRHSSRCDKPLIRVNCATIPKELYESEFFGHVKGAFTGAVKDRIGRFEAANGGTIFLDEIGEIPIDLQSKLLRVLQGGEYERIGEDITRKVDVRVISATNKDLEKEVAAKQFRDDLFFRLNVFPIQIAPLRKRKEDIPQLAMHFVKKISKNLDLPCPRLTKANIMDLQQYHWPGNVRELENAIERALILSRSNSLRFDVNSEVFRATEQTTDNRTRISKEKDILSEFEITELIRQNMVTALRRCNWKIYGAGGAAELIGINPTTLIERMKRMKIIKPR